ncbi:hypothetical protein VZC37_18060 [Gordonia sp. LSe1-13]|uniref:Uncharacterized protein n=1 Tax=Gordonia sesuvii TaxID=3116777 RepID=A0ABU7MGK8_9ACTN|nr:hypothetical protein [Gordonia sp. LSe1-13]
MHEEEPSILATLGIDPATAPPPPDDVWNGAMQAAFDPSATADPDTVPDMDDTPPAEGDDDEIVVEPAVDNEQGDTHASPALDDDTGDTEYRDADLDIEGSSDGAGEHIPDAGDQPDDDHYDL